MQNSKFIKPLIILGYSGHSFGVIEAWLEKGAIIKGYTDLRPKLINPFNIFYLGQDKILKNYLDTNTFHLALGDILLRKKILKNTFLNGVKFQKIISSQANVSELALVNDGTYVARGASINPYSIIGKNCIINTSCIIDHGVKIGNNSHIAPGAVLAGNVKVGNNVFVGANSIIKENTCIGDNTIIGAGSVVLKNVRKNDIVAGNPSKQIGTL